MKAKKFGSHGQPFGVATALSYLLLQDFGSGPLSQLSSAVSSANFPDCRPLWHLMMQAIALAAALPTAFSHFAKPLFDVTNPPSSPPNGVCAMANPTTSMTANPPINASLLTMCLTSWEPAARPVSSVRILGAVVRVERPLARRQFR